MCSITGCTSQTPRSTSLAATQTTIATLTAAHEAEARSLIENYHLSIASNTNVRDSEALSEVMTGPLLGTLTASGTPVHESSFYRTRSIVLSEVYVVEYTPSQVKVVGCGELHDEHVYPQEERVELLPPYPLENIYVFVWEDEKWKLFTLYPLSDRDSALQSWTYVSEEERSAIGNLEDYFDLYLPCTFP